MYAATSHETALLANVARKATQIQSVKSASRKDVFCCSQMAHKRQSQGITSPVTFERVSCEGTCGRNGNNGKLHRQTEQEERVGTEEVFVQHMVELARQIQDCCET